MRFIKAIFAGIICAVLIGGAAFGEEKESTDLLVLWSSGDRDIAMNMVFMYTFNSKKNGWWENIRFLIWGASSKLLSTDKELQQAVANATAKALAAREESVKQIPFWEQLRERNRATKQRVLGSLGHYLQEFEANCLTHGIHVHWAADGAEALAIITSVAKQNNVQKIANREQYMNTSTVSN